MGKNSNCPSLDQVLFYPYSSGYLTSDDRTVCLQDTATLPLHQHCTALIQCKLHEEDATVCGLSTKGIFSIGTYKQKGQTELPFEIWFT